nr:hypothetical protein [Legionella antarctica]
MNRTINVVVLGESRSGKSSLIERLAKDTFSPSNQSSHERSLVNNDGVSMIIYEGEQRTTESKGTESYLLKANVAVICVDLSVADAVTKLQTDYNYIEQKNEHAKIFIALTKSDLVSNDFKDKYMEDIKKWLRESSRAEENCIETSAKTGMNTSRLKDCINKAVFELSPIDNSYKNSAKDRIHLFKATLNSNKNQNCTFLNEEEKKLTGDALKGKILDKFKNELESSVGPEKFKEVVAKITASPEYQIIKTSQGLASKILGLETDSHKTLRDMISQRKTELNIGENDGTLSSKLEI